MLKDELNQILSKASMCIQNSSIVSEIESIRVDILGKKGKLTNILKQMGKLSPQERPQVGKLANEVRDKLEQLIQNKLLQIKSKELQEQLQKEKIEQAMLEGLI